MVMGVCEWIAPKIDWQISYDADGNYIGDYFEPNDYNRIKNNINYLYGYVKQLFDNAPEIYDLGEDVYYGSKNELKASWWTMMQDNLRKINDASLQIEIGVEEKYSSNSPGRLLEELNRVEQSILNMYTKLHEIEKNKQRLSFRLGNWRGF